MRAIQFRMWYPIVIQSFNWQLKTILCATDLNIYLFDFPVENMQQKVNYHYYSLSNFIQHDIINFGWREQVETTSMMPVNHISELKSYKEIIYNSII